MYYVKVIFLADEVNEGAERICTATSKDDAEWLATTLQECAGCMVDILEAE